MLRFQPPAVNRSFQSSRACRCEGGRHAQGRCGEAAAAIARNHPAGRAVQPADTVMRDGGRRRFDDNASGHLETLFVMEVRSTSAVACPPRLRGCWHARGC